MQQEVVRVTFFNNDYNKTVTVSNPSVEDVMSLVEKLSKTIGRTSDKKQKTKVQVRLYEGSKSITSSFKIFPGIDPKHFYLIFKSYEN